MINDATDPSDARRRRVRSFVRRPGRLTPAQARALDELLPHYALDPALTDLRVAFDRRAPLIVEIGCGNGEALIEMASAEPDRNFIGIEVHEPGVGRLLRALHERQLGNVRVAMRDAVEVLREQAVPASIDGLRIYFPDPWPKKRHHRRRFVTPDHLLPLARVMAAGAEFRLATDIPDYVRQALEEVPQAGFDLVAQGGEPWDDWISTRYEQKALREGRVPHYLSFRRNG